MRHCLRRSATDPSNDLLLIAHGSLQDHVALETEADGNCFFYSISNLLFGDPCLKKVKLLRLGATFMLFEYGETFLNLFSETLAEYSFEEYVIQALDLKSYANMYVVAAISLLINRPIFVYQVSIMEALDERSNLSEIRGSSVEVCFLKNDQTKRPLGIGLRGEHYVPLFPRAANHSLPIPDESYLLNFQLRELDAY